MRRIAIVAALLIASAAAVAPTASAAWYDPHHPAMGCANSHGDPVPRVKPRTCDTWFRWLAHYQTSGYLKRLRWHHWGSKAATARGRLLYNGAHLRVRVRVYRIRCIASYPVREGCAYTRLSTRTANGHGVQKLPWGFDLWPEY
jgi:hypothetical protein